MKHLRTLAALLTLCAPFAAADAAIVSLGNYLEARAHGLTIVGGSATSTNDAVYTGAFGSYGGAPVFSGTSQIARSVPAGDQVVSVGAVNSVSMVNDLVGPQQAFTISGTQSAEVVACATPVGCTTNARAETELQLYFQVTDAPEEATFTYDFLPSRTGDPNENGSVADFRLTYEGLGSGFPGGTNLFRLFAGQDGFGPRNTSGTLELTLPVGLYTFSFLNQVSAQAMGTAISQYELNLRFGPELQPVPLPAAAWLLLSGLGGVAAFARRRRAAASATAA